MIEYRVVTTDAKEGGLWRSKLVSKHRSYVAAIRRLIKERKARPATVQMRLFSSEPWRWVSERSLKRDCVAYAPFD